VSARRCEALCLNVEPRGTQCKSYDTGPVFLAHNFVPHLCWVHAQAAQNPERKVPLKFVPQEP
jgi:hypothetical protein